VSSDFQSSVRTILGAVAAAVDQMKQGRNVISGATTPVSREFGYASPFWPSSEG
jgi:hypothetical protein